MQTPLQVTMRNMDRSEALDADIRQRVDKLCQHYSEIISCQIIVEAPLQHKRKGGLFKVRIDISCPVGKVVINKEPPAQRRAHEDVYVALRDAFNAADRKLEEYTSRRKGHIKAHQEQGRGEIIYLSPMEDYGMIVTVDDRQIYFHRNSVLNMDFDQLEIGTNVQFHEEEGDKGPKASSVKVVK